MASIRYWRFRQIRAGTPTAKETTTSQAPSLNFTMTKISTTMSEVTPGREVDDQLAAPAPFPVLWWYMAMPNPAMVNAVNTPSA